MSSAGTRLFGFNSKTFVKVFFFGIILLSTLYFSKAAIESLGGSPTQWLAIWTKIPLKTMVLVLLLTGLYYSLDWIRFGSLLSLVGYRPTPLQGLELTSVSYFVSCLTPASSLHAPAMITLLRLRGVPIPQGTAVTLTKTLIMLFWICLLTFLGLTLTPETPVPPLLRPKLPWLAISAVPLLLLLATAVIFPNPLLKFLEPFKSNDSLKPNPWINRLLTGFSNIIRTVALIGRSSDHKHLMCHLASMTFVLCYTTIGWYLCLAGGFSISFLQALGIFTTSLFIAYFSPVPGGIGITEVSTGYLIDPSLTPEAMAIAILIRLLCWYGITPIGVAIVLKKIRQF
jgi:uncharacterized protein (TIRG00374 family)